MERKDAISNGSKIAAAWVREVAEPLSVVRTPRGLVSDPLEIVKLVTQAWNPIFQHNEGWSREQIDWAREGREEFPFPSWKALT